MRARLRSPKKRGCACLRLIRGLIGADSESGGTLAKQLVITEKPSVARDIVAALGGFTEHDGYWESDEYVVTFSVGHIVELLSPEDVDPIYKRWTLDTLPILPGEFKLKQKQGQSERIRTIKKLLAREGHRGRRERLRRRARGRADLPRDPRVPRERQADQAPVAAVDDAGLDPQRLPHAGRRLAVRRARRGGVVPLEVGLADRHERDPRADPPPEGPQGEDRVVGRARADADPGDRGRPRARDPGARGAALLAAPREVPDAATTSTRAPGSTRPSARPRARSASSATTGSSRSSARTRLLETLTGKPAAASETRKPSRETAPPLFDLTSLQREGNRRFGWSARRTLERGAALLRGAQAPHLSAHRLALPAQRLPRERRPDDRDVRRRRPVPGRGRAAAPRTGSRTPSAPSTTPRSPTTSRSSRPASCPTRTCRATTSGCSTS